MSRTPTEETAWKDCENSTSLRGRGTFNTDSEFLEYARGAIEWFVLKGPGTFDGPDPNWADLLESVAQMQITSSASTDTHVIQSWRDGAAAGNELLLYRRAEIPYQIGFVGSALRSLFTCEYSEAAKRAEDAS